MHQKNATKRDLEGLEYFCVLFALALSAAQSSTLWSDLSCLHHVPSVGYKEHFRAMAKSLHPLQMAMRPTLIPGNVLKKSLL